MANLKRLFVVVLTVAMIVTSMATAFAAPLTDLSGKKYEDSVNKLAGFGIVAGDNGQFKGESKLTRAEFATFIVKMLGLGEQSKVDTLFSDATSGDWYSGYVNVVTENGIMVGVGDGKFAPNKNVTYGEAITVLMKMLGYAPVVDGRGTWPNNYISRASNIKLTKDVAVSGSADVTRGNLGSMMWKAMITNKLVESGTYDKDGNPEYNVATAADHKTLLYENFNEAVAVDDETIDPVAVTDVPLLSDGTGDINKVKVNGTWYTVPAGFDANSLLGMDIYFVADKDDNMVWVKVATKSEYVLNDTVKEIAAKSTGDKVDRIKFMTSDKSYYAADNMVLVYNGATVANTTTDMNKVLPLIAETVYMSGVQDPATIKAVLDKDTSKIKYAVITQDTGSLSFSNVATQTVNTWFGIVGEVSDKVKGQGFDDIDYKDLLSRAENKSIKLFVSKNGKTATLNDIKKDDFIRYTNFGSTYVFSVFTPKIETMKFDSMIDTAGGLTTVSVVAGDKKLRFGTAAYRNLKKAVTDRGNLSFDQLENFMGVEGTKVYYGPSGRVNYIENQVAESDANYGFVTDVDAVTVNGDSVYKVTMITPDGTTVSYDTVVDVILSTGYSEDNYRAHVIAYKLNKENEISSLASMSTGGFGSDTGAAKAKRGVIGKINPSNTNVGNADSNDEYIAGTQSLTTKFYVNSSTVFLNWQSANYASWLTKTTQSDKEDFNFQFDTVSWDSVKAASVRGDLATRAFGEAGYTNGVAKFVVLQASNLSSSLKYGVVVGTGYTDGKQTVLINNKGTVSEYRYTDTTDTVYAVKGLLAYYNVDSKSMTFGPTINSVANANYSPAIFAYNSSNGQIQYKAASGSNYVVGKLTNVDAAARTIQYKNYETTKINNVTYTYTNGRVKGDATAAYIRDDAGIYNLTDLNNITYSTDVATLVKDMYIVYDQTANVVLIVKPNDIPERSMIGDANAVR